MEKLHLVKDINGIPKILNNELESERKKLYDMSLHIDTMKHDSKYSKNDIESVTSQLKFLTTTFYQKIEKCPTYGKKIK